MNKVDLRRRCRKIREGLSPQEVRASSQAVCHHLTHWPVFQQARTVLTFLAFRNEPDLSQLFGRWPDKRWLAPRIVENDEKPCLALHLYDPARLVRHVFGMLEPAPDLPAVDPGEVRRLLASDAVGVQDLPVLDGVDNDVAAPVFADQDLVGGQRAGRAAQKQARAGRAPPPVQAPAAPARGAGAVSRGAGPGV